jgi:hypothetical protein
MDPWYKVATPRKEVREGRSFNPNEFAIALEQVVAGTAPEDYRDPAQFFARTCFTRALREHAGMVLRRLSGRPHVVMTGVSLRQGPHELGRVVTTEVYLRDLSDEDLDWYVASGEGRDKAGAYAIQGLAARFIPRIDGSYSNVVGLPVACVAELLTSLLASNG